MGILFPVHRPRVGLSFTERSLALVELRRGWRKPRVVRVHERAVPEGLLTPSACESNVKDSDALAKELRALVAASSERTMALCLPDRACRLAVFPFETLPPRERDRDPILRWRFQHEEHMTVADAHVLHRVFPVNRPTSATANEAYQDSKVTAYVVALAITRSILNEYEQVCAQAGLLPISISCAALWAFDFYRPMLAKACELFFVHQASDAMTFLAIRQGMPVFCRMKPRCRDQADGMREVWSTVQFYEDLYPPPRSGADRRPVPLYVVGGSDASMMFPIAERGKEESSAATRPIMLDPGALVSMKRETVLGESGYYAMSCAGAR